MPPSRHGMCFPSKKLTTCFAGEEPAVPLSQSELPRLFSSFLPFLFFVFFFSSPSTSFGLFFRSEMRSYRQRQCVEIECAIGPRLLLCVFCFSLPRTPSPSPPDSRGRTRSFLPSADAAGISRDSDTASFSQCFGYKLPSTRSFFSFNFRSWQCSDERCPFSSLFLISSSSFPFLFVLYYLSRPSLPAMGGTKSRID